MFMVCCTLVCGLNGCTFFGSGSSNEFRSDEELADEMIEKIIACVEKEDAEGLTELFSPYAKDSTLNLAEQEEDFIDFFQGECESWKGNASSQEKSEHGKTIWRKLRGHYSIITDEAQYEIAYTYIPFHREEPDKEGLTAIEITTEENFDKEDFLWSLDQRPGIYVTEEGEEDLSRQKQITPEELIQAADLTKEHFAKKNISYICFHYELNGQQYADDLGQSMPFDQFYKAMQDGATTKTSQINADEFTEYFEGFLKEGKDILHVCLSSGITGVVNSANIAREELAEKYPDRKILIVDSLGASSGYGLLMDRLADLRDEGKTIEEVYQWAEAHKLNLHHWFFSTDLTFYIRGGRISKTSGFFGTMLNICPLLNMDDQGRLIPRYKIRTKKKVIRAIVDKMEEYAEGGLDYSGKCYISQSACIEDAREVARLVEERFPKLNGKVEINSIGTTIGSHTGPGTVALFFWGSKRTA